MDYTEILYPDANSVLPPLWWCDTHEWAINANNSGRCMRCKLYVSSYKQLSDIDGCTPHLVRAFGNWKQMRTKEAA
jgi:hypothetical protein